MKQLELTGFVVSRKNLKDSDKIITVFTREKGKVSIVAKGIKKPKAKLQAHIEPLVESRFRVIKSGHLPVLVGAQGLSRNEFFGSTTESSLAGLFLTEVVDRFSAEELTNEALYEAYKQSLDLLLESDKTSLILTFSILNILKSLGLEPHISFDGKGQRAYFNLSDGEISKSSAEGESVLVDKDLVKLWKVCMVQAPQVFTKLVVDNNILSSSLNLLLSYLQYNMDSKIKSIKVLSEGTNLLQAG